MFDVFREDKFYTLEDESGNAGHWKPQLAWGMFPNKSRRPKSGIFQRDIKRQRL